jgi:hypothetical protein
MLGWNNATILVPTETPSNNPGGDLNNNVPSKQSTENRKKQRKDTSAEKQIILNQADEQAQKEAKVRADQAALIAAEKAKRERAQKERAEQEQAQKEAKLMEEEAARIATEEAKITAEKAKRLEQERAKEQELQKIQQHRKT